MSAADFAALAADTEQQLQISMAAIGTGQMIDLTDLLPRIDALCEQAVTLGSRPAGERLAGILTKLDQLQAALRQEIARLGAETRPDPKQAAESYRAAMSKPDKPQ
jgi:hypothetical protein